MGPHAEYAKSILLPFDQVFRNLKNAKRFAIDIGTYLCMSVLKNDDYWDWKFQADH